MPGMLATATTLPVIGVPIALAVLDGLDSLLSIVQMPRGVPVATDDAPAVAYVNVQGPVDGSDPTDRLADVLSTDPAVKAPPLRQVRPPRPQAGPHHRNGRRPNDRARPGPPRRDADRLTADVVAIRRRRRAHTSTRRWPDTTTLGARSAVLRSHVGDRSGNPLGVAQSVQHLGAHTPSLVAQQHAVDGAFDGSRERFNLVFGGPVFDDRQPPFQRLKPSGNATSAGKKPTGQGPVGPSVIQSAHRSLCHSQTPFPKANRTDRWASSQCDWAHGQAWAQHLLVDRDRPQIRPQPSQRAHRPLQRAPTEDPVTQRPLSSSD